MARARRQHGRTLVAVCIAVVALGTIYIVAGPQPASAQMAPGGGMPGGRAMPGMPPPWMMGAAPPGAGLAMVVHKDMIYIATGGKLYKIDPEKMELVGELTFQEPPPPVGPMPPGAGAVPGVFGQPGR